MSKKQVIVYPVRCFCAVTREGTLIPWLCDTDRERLIVKLKELRVTWRTRAVQIVPEEDGDA